MRQYFPPTFVFSALALVLLPSLGEAVLGQELLEVVRDGHQASTQAIRTLHCRVAVADQGVQANPASGEYWRSDRTVRVRWDKAGKHHDMIVNGALTKTTSTLNANGREQRVLVISRSSGMPHGDCDVWYLGLLASLPDHPEDPEPLAFSDLLARQKGNLALTREHLDGRNLIRVTFSRFAGQTEELSFDPQVNYLVRKRVHTATLEGPTPGVARIEHEVERFREVQKTTYFPEKIHFRGYHNGSLLFSQEVTLSSIQVNQPIPQETFATRYEQGMLVLDNVAGIQYSVDASGGRNGSTKPLADVPPLPVAPTLRTETHEEPKSMSRWLFPGSVGLLAVAGCLWVYRRWRSRPEATTGD